jgi:hypothetical protein
VSIQAKAAIIGSATINTTITIRLAQKACHGGSMARNLREVIAAVQAERRAKIVAAYRQKLIAIDSSVPLKAEHQKLGIARVIPNRSDCYCAQSLASLREADWLLGATRMILRPERLTP